MPRNSKSLSKRKPTFEKWVEDVVARIQTELNLQNWRIGIMFDEVDPEALEDTTAWASIDTRYTTAYLHFTENARHMWDSGRMVALTECVVHEVSHILLEPLHVFAKQAASPQTEPHLTDILERTNQRLTRIVMDLLPPKFFQY